MTIISINTQTTGLAGPQTRPHRCTMITTDNFGTITAPGFLNRENIYGMPIENTDLFDILYDFDELTKKGTYGKFVVTMDGADFILENAPSTDIGIPSLNGQTLLNINSNGFSPMYQLKAVKDFLMAPNGVILTADNPAVATTLFAVAGDTDVSVLASASTNGALLIAAKIDDVENPTTKHVFLRAVFGTTQFADGGLVNDSNTTPWVFYNNVTYVGPMLDVTTEISYETAVLSVTFNQPVIFNKANQYNEAVNGNAGIATLVAGTVTIANTAITANSRILLSVQTAGGTPGFLSIANKTAGVGFDILSSSNLETSVVYYEIREPA